MVRQNWLRHSLSLLAIFFLLAGCGPENTTIRSQTASPTPVQAATVPEATDTPIATGLSQPTETVQPQPQETVSGEAITNTAEPAAPVLDEEVAGRIRQVENGLVPFLEVMGAEPQPMDLASRMAYYQVPGISIAVINEGVIEWARGYGAVQAGGGNPVTPETLFQAASMSKPVTAVGALALVQDGLLDLDGDVNGQLTSWTLPESPLASAERVTVRRILSHTAGLTVHGFPGYPPGAALPSAVQILEGRPPANSPPVLVASTPGSRYDYSGGGYVLLQQLMEDVTGQVFPDLLDERVLEPLGLDHSTFVQPLPPDLAAQAAAGHRFGGSPIEGGWHVYPEMAPAGLWTTATDLARFLIEVERAGRGEGEILAQETASLMLTPVLEDNGLGWVLPEGGELFGHGGSNQGFRGLMFAVRGAGQGAVVMANSDTGMQLIFEIFRSIAGVYGWPQVEAWRVAERGRAGFVKVDPAAFEPLVGRYQVQGLMLEIASEEGSLWVQIPSGGPLYRLFPDSETEFFTTDGNGFVFLKDVDGNVASLQMNGWGDQELIATKLN